MKKDKGKEGRKEGVKKHMRKQERHGEDILRTVHTHIMHRETNKYAYF